MSVDVSRSDLAAAVQLRAAGVSLVLNERSSGLPAIAYWGADLGELSAETARSLLVVNDGPGGDSLVDVPEQVSVLPSPAEAWIGRPGLLGSRDGAAFSALFVRTHVEDVEPDPLVAGGRRYWLTDDTAELALDLEIQLSRSGLVKMRAELTNTGRTVYQLDGLTLTLPLPSRATEVFDMTGRHTRERVPQRTPLFVGTHLRESRQGRPGLDSAFVLGVGTAGFGWESGEFWGVHTGWSGNQACYAEKLFNGRQLIGAGELPLPGEIRLEPGEAYQSPWIYGVHGAGLNAVAHRFHGYLRARPEHPKLPRPVLVNTWEAAYFDHDLDRLSGLAHAAAEVGVERFVLDDGWFRGRRNDRAGLGDWYVDPAVWPDGLDPIIDVVAGLGMQFGLWVEPEMINLDSDLARAHPEWIFRAGGREGISSRYQYVLDLGHPEAYAYIAGCLHDLLDTYPISYVKWDHNRVVIEAGHTPAGAPGVHAHTLAVYRLMDELKLRHPGLEIESCAGGGGRIDLGIIERTDRVWPSDCIDALERQQIQRYTQLLLPPELIGTHLGDSEAHSTHRRHHLGFRAATALWGHMGIEWDLTAASPGKQAEVRRWVTLHKSLRPLLHTGDVFVGDHPDPAVWVNGVVANDKSDAVYAITTVARPLTFPPGNIRLPGLDPHRMYHLAPLPPADRYPGTHQYPQWWADGITLPGRVLTENGVQAPAMYPEYMHVLRAQAQA